MRWPSLAGISLVSWPWKIWRAATTRQIFHDLSETEDRRSRHRRGDVGLGNVPAGHADHRGRALQVGRVVGDGERLRLAGPERDVVVLPERGLQFVVSGQLLAACRAAPDIGPQQEADCRRGRGIGDRYRGGQVRAVGSGLLGRCRRDRDRGLGQCLQPLQVGVLFERGLRLAQALPPVAGAPAPSLLTGSQELNTGNSLPSSVRKQPAWSWRRPGRSRMSPASSGLTRRRLGGDCPGRDRETQSHEFQGQQETNASPASTMKMM